MIVENFLLKHAGKLKQSLPIDQVLPRIIKEHGLMKIDQLASLACLSTRQLEKVFQQRIGLPPKHFCRLVRFAQAWVIKQQQPGISWIKIGFQPGALHRLLGEPMYKMLPYRNYDGEVVFGYNVKHVTDALANAVSFETMKNIIDDFIFSLLSKFRKPLAIDAVIPEILRHGGDSVGNTYC